MSDELKKEIEELQHHIDTHFQHKIGQIPERELVILAADDWMKRTFHEESDYRTFFSNTAIMLTASLYVQVN